MAIGFIRGLLDLLFPPKCVFCRKVLKNGERDICAKCKEELPFTEGSSAVQPGEFYSKCVSPLFYKDNAREALLRFKFKGATNYVSCFGKLMADCVGELLKDEYNLITWVPLSAKRQKKRGYDQAMLLAMAVALELEDVAVETLVKTVDTPAQSGLDAVEARKANVIGAFEVQDKELIEGKRILLVDDVVTTGSTLSECARVLLSVGAESVVCATLTRTE